MAGCLRRMQCTAATTCRFCMQGLLAIANAASKASASSTERPPSRNSSTEQLKGSEDAVEHLFWHAPLFHIWITIDQLLDLHNGKIHL